MGACVPWSWRHPTPSLSQGEHCAHNHGHPVGWAPSPGIPRGTGLRLPALCLQPRVLTAGSKQQEQSSWVMLRGSKQERWGLGGPAARSPRQRCPQRKERIPLHGQPPGSHCRTPEQGEAEGCSRLSCAGAVLQPPSPWGRCPWARGPVPLAPPHRNKGPCLLRLLLLTTEHRCAESKRFIDTWLSVELHYI